MDEPRLSPEILSYYAGAWDEDARLRTGLGELEFLRTQEIVRRLLPEPGRQILDVGGASGVHAEWLLDDGHCVHLLDPVPEHVSQASDRLGAHPRFTAEVGDGRRLPVADGSHDMVLLFGPLYHLTERADRLATWREASRVLRPGGVVVASVITRFASLFSGLSSGDLFDPAFASVVAQDLRDGRHRNPGGRDWFTTAYFHHPSEVTEEASEAGLEVDGTYGVEGIASWIPGLARRWSDPGARPVIIEAARAIESEPTLMGLGPHLLVVARPASS
jgi:ubiquinone/menaquinone biosynthesis C-methylase UbiE